MSYHKLSSHEPPFDAQSFLPPRVNSLLAALPEADYECLLPHLKPVSLSRGDVIYNADERIQTVYFLTSGLISMIANATPSTDSEVYIVARHGMLGMRSIIFGGGAAERATVQIEGNAYSMPAAEIQEEFKRSGPLRDQLLRYVQLVLVQTTQRTLCNRLHSAEGRLCHWLLTVGQRMGIEELELTQKFLGQMLGTSRSDALAAASALRTTGLIDYTRDPASIRIKIVDHRGLENAACECYSVIRQEFDRLFPS
jgi:CRP-like cAMP-binding protein